MPTQVQSVDLSVRDRSFAGVEDFPLSILSPAGFLASKGECSRSVAPFASRRRKAPKCGWLDRVVGVAGLEPATLSLSS